MAGPIQKFNIYLSPTPYQKTNLMQNTSTFDYGEYLGIVLGLFFPSSFTRACTTLNCLRLRFPCTVHRFASNCQFYEGSEGRTYLEPPMKPCDWLAPTLSIIPRHSSRVGKLRTTSKIFRACCENVIRFEASVIQTTNISN